MNPEFLMKIETIVLRRGGVIVLEIPEMNFRP
jgi:hypothetical protein